MQKEFMTTKYAMGFYMPEFLNNDTVPNKADKFKLAKYHIRRVGKIPSLISSDEAEHHLELIISECIGQNKDSDYTSLHYQSSPVKSPFSHSCPESPPKHKMKKRKFANKAILFSSSSSQSH